MSDVSRESPPVPEVARGVFASARLPLAEAYVAWLAGAGTVRGLLGPREIPRLWERHVLNSAVLGEVVPEGARVCDVGSGAGLPGLALAIARPDLHVTLLEPLLRRTVFLEEVVADLGLQDQVAVLRGRAEQAGERGATYDVVTARAVAPLERLLGWCLPLASRRGELLAMKGSSAEREVADAQKSLRRLGCRPAEVLTLGVGVLAEPTFAVRVVRGASGR